MAITEKEFNGLGRRVTNVETQIGVQSSKMERSETDIQKIFKSMERLPIIIIVSICIPTLMVLYQILTK